MTVLRSRVISSPSLPPKSSPKNGFIIEPLTPNKPAEALQMSYASTPSPSPIRRSGRLANKSSFDGDCVVVVNEGIQSGEGCVGSTRKRKSVGVEIGSNQSDVGLDESGSVVVANEGNQSGSSSVGSTRKSKSVGVENGSYLSDVGLDVSVSTRKKVCRSGIGSESVGVEVLGEGDGGGGCVNLRSGKRIIKGGVNGSDQSDVGLDERGSSGKKICRNFSGSVGVGVDVSGEGKGGVCVNLRSGKRVLKGGVNGKVAGGCVVKVENDDEDNVVYYEDGVEGKVGESTVVLASLASLGSGVENGDRDNVVFEDGVEIRGGVSGGDSVGRRRSGRLQKGKEKAVEVDLLPTIDVKVELESVVNGEKVMETGGTAGKSKRKLSTEEKGKGKAVEVDLLSSIDVKGDLQSVVNGKELIINGVSGDCVLDEMETGGTAGRSKRKLSMKEKGKGKAVEVELSPSIDVKGELQSVANGEELIENGVSGDCVVDEMKTSGAPGRSKRKLSTEEKGKGKAVEVNISSSHVANMELVMEQRVEKSNGSEVSGASNVVGRNERPVNENPETDDTKRTRRMQQFHDIARRNASRFAHFPSQEEEEHQVVGEAERGIPQREVNEEVEDWPGPFSTAMKIIKDRESKVVAPQKSVLDEGDINFVNWVPKKKDGSNHLKRVAPSLQEMSMQFLAKNADAITSLNSVPDALRHKISQLLCDSRRMNAHFLDLLASGTPTEIRVRDCSWLSEEQFTKTFEGCDVTKLMVLQLDQCGRCLPDYTLFATLARSSHHLPALTTLSVKGACRLSDSGLRALVSSAPSLRSINLGQCSLLTADAIQSLASTLGLVLKELYLDDCDSIDPMLIVPALSRLKHLEVLSLAGIHTVSDDFISQFVTTCGQNLKELSLANCMKLTDSSLKAIAETCSELCSIDLTNLKNLTDSAIGYLANGRLAIQTLKLSRNAFSDEAVAAYLETCGESLKELSLNNVKVSQNTAISLSKRSRNLLSLDLSFCRDLTDEAVGLIVDSCLSLKILKLFGCTQITNVFTDGHSNPQVQIIGLKFSPILKHIEVPELIGPLHYSSA